jgi:hypothetical protein
MWIKKDEKKSSSKMIAEHLQTSRSVGYFCQGQIFSRSYEKKEANNNDKMMNIESSIQIFVKLTLLIGDRGNEYF